MNVKDKINQIINEIKKEVDKEQIVDIISYQIGVIEGLTWALEIFEQPALLRNVHKDCTFLPANRFYF